MFKYEVAFSFLESDEALATELDNLLNSRLKTFIYTNKQAQLAGTDGEESFNQVFGKEARTVVVLYRPNWGSTAWTRIEQTAIRNRAYEDGYDFVLFVMLEKGISPPQWLPKNRIWFGLERWGAQGLASVIEARVQEVGGEIKEETSEQKAIRISRQINAVNDKKRLLNSEQGVKIADEATGKLFAEIKRITQSVFQQSSDVKLTCEYDHATCIARGSGYSIILNWQRQWANTLDHSALYFRVFRGSLSLASGVYIHEPEVISEYEFDFDLDSSGAPAWRGRGGSSAYSAEGFAGHCIETLLKQIQEQVVED